LELRCDAALLILPYWSAFCGVTAARLYGLVVPDGDQRIHVAVPSATKIIPRTGNPSVHSYTIPVEHLRRIGGRCVVTPERLFLELAAALSRIDLIIGGDQILRKELTTPEALERFLRASPRRRGVRKARAAVPLLEKNTCSPPESRLRMLLIDAGLPRPVANQDIVNHWGVLLATPDLAYPQWKIAIQYEGSHHQEDHRQYSFDIERDGRLIDDGWIVIRVNKEGLFNPPHLVIDRVRKAIGQRRDPR
jgi:hypothetical protein